MDAIYGSVYATDGHALDQRLNGLAATVCDDDPRTAKQRRADAMAALAAGADRLSRTCGRDGCPAGARPPAPNVVLHVVADQSTVDGHSDAPAIWSVVRS
jgi:hypothetical protein